MSEDFKKLIDKMFEEKKEERKEEVEESPQEEISNKKFRNIGLPEAVDEVSYPSYVLDFPESPPRTKEQNQKAVKYAMSEMERIREAFLEFTDKVNDTVLYGQLYGEIEEFVETCKELTVLIEDGIDKEKLTSGSANDYERLRKMRDRLLQYVLDKYEKKD